MHLLCRPEQSVWYSEGLSGITVVLVWIMSSLKNKSQECLHCCCTFSLVKVSVFSSTQQGGEGVLMKMSVSACPVAHCIRTWLLDALSNTQRSEPWCHWLSLLMTLAHLCLCFLHLRRPHVRTMNSIWPQVIFMPIVITTHSKIICIYYISILDQAQIWWQSISSKNVKKWKQSSSQEMWPQSWMRKLL